VAEVCFFNGIYVINVTLMIVKIFLTLTIVFLIAPQHAFAYLDPGTGSILFQLLIGSVVGGIFFVTSKLELIKARIRQFRKKEEKDSHDDR